VSAERTKESALWGWLRDSRPRLNEPRVEDATKSGTPDVEGCIGGRPFWAELKVAYEQRTRGTVRVKTTVDQVYFAIKRRQAGGLSWYLIRVGTYPKWGHYLIPGQHAEELLDRPIALDRLRNLSAAPIDARPEALLMAASWVEGALQLL
jgi:hypothetical protein